MQALWLVNQLWLIVSVNPWKNRASSEFLYKSNRPQVSMHHGLYSDKTRVFDQSQRAQGPIYIIIINRPLFLWVYRRNKPRGMLGEHEESL